ncbi:MAG: hypothetical protein ACREYF_27335, partial [Gammaproteobacteria bacterium]
VLRQGFLGDCVVEHPADSNPIDVPALNTETDDAPGTDIHYHHDPGRFAGKQTHTEINPYSTNYP